MECDLRGLGVIACINRRCGGGGTSLIFGRQNLFKGVDGVFGFTASAIRDTEPAQGGRAAGGAPKIPFPGGSHRDSNAQIRMTLQTMKKSREQRRTRERGAREGLLVIEQGFLGEAEQIEKLGSLPPQTIEQMAK